MYREAVMKQEMMTIVRQRELAPRIYELVLAGELVKEMTMPGQFLHIRVPRSDLLLRRPISINQYDPAEGTCTIIYRIEGDGTKYFAEMSTGDQLDVMGPLGHGFEIEGLSTGDTAFIVGGGIGVPPLYQLSKELKAKGVKVIHFLGFGSQEVVYYADEFQALGETRFSTDDGTYGIQGNVGNLLMAASEQPDAVFACGNNGLLKTVEQLYTEVDNVQLSLESRMACGMGACYACVCHVPEDENKSVKVCEDGPVFQAGEVIF
ncbi:MULTISPECIES: dihydroorotate dehydrogenase electron transfer subunit [unclassified Enterococcus]|uniref:dihydroorotate dehydrogenase electron transfer subunit n=1 Tax=unclassified Enterococcus TaxID=2608891 RepID=UPI003D2B2D4D